MAISTRGLRELSLFSGAGGGLLATQHLLGWETQCYVERDPYCVKVLKQRMADGLLHDAPIWDDARTFDGRPWRGLVDVVSAGFPCVPFSLAGLRQAERDDRNGWPWVARILREVGPRFVFLENVAALTAGPYFGQILGELRELGYDYIRWTCLSAAQCGAPHQRNRLWILAVADPVSEGLALGEGELGDTREKLPTPQRGGDVGGWWSAGCPVRRVAHGVAPRLDRKRRFRALGNAQVPAVARAAWQVLTT